MVFNTGWTLHVGQNKMYMCVLFHFLQKLYFSQSNIILAFVGSSIMVHYFMKTLGMFSLFKLNHYLITECLI